LKKFKNTNKLYKVAKHQVCIFPEGSPRRIACLYSTGCKSLTGGGNAPNCKQVAEAERVGVRQLADQSPILNTTITVARLTQRGYESLLTHYYKVSPHYQSSPLFNYWA